jgi:hypothetical protein
MSTESAFRALEPTSIVKELSESCPTAKAPSLKMQPCSAGHSLTRVNLTNWMVSRQIL